MGKLILGILLGTLRVIGIILLVLLALLLLLLLIRVHVRASYENGAPSLWVRYGPVKLQLFPKKEKDAPPKKKKPPKAKKPKKEKKEKKKFQINMDQVLYSLETLPPILGRVLKRTGRSIHVEPLKLYVLVAGSDPADTALLYGKLEAAVAGGLPVLEKALRLKDPDIQLYLDFMEQRMDFIADVGVSLRPIRLVWMALRAGGSLIKWFFGFRKLASPPAKEEPEQKETKETPETEHEAA